MVAAVEGAGHEAILTAPEHPSGSDRIAEALRGREAGVVLNVQGDEPLVDPAHLDALVEALLTSGAGAATIAVAEGDAVQEGQALLILEAMKMENELRAEASGTVQEIHVEPGMTVDRNDLLAVIE